MQFSLRNKFEEALATINPFDGGKTASTVRATRPTQPAQTVAKPKQSLGMKVRDVFDANSTLDRQKRIAKGQPELYQDQQRAMGNVRPNQNFAQALASPTLRATNTALTLSNDTLPKAGAGLVLKGLRKTGVIDSRKYNDSVNKLYDSAMNKYGTTGGLFNAGTVFNDPKELENANFGTVAKKSVAYGAGVYGDLSPVQAGKAVKGTRLLPTLLKKSALGATESALGDAGLQYADTGRINPKQVAQNAVFGGVLPHVSDGGSKLLGKGRKVIQDMPTDRDITNILEFKQNRGGFADDNVYTERLNSLRKLGIDPTKPEAWTQIDNVLAQYNRSLSQGGYIKNPLANDAPQVGKTEITDPMQKVFDQNPMSVGNVIKQKERYAKDVAKDAKINADFDSRGAELPEFNTKKTSVLDKAFRSTRSIIERQGKSGQELAGLLQKSRDIEEMYQSDLLSRLKTVRSLKGKDYENFVDATQGLVEPNNPKVAQAIQEWKSVHPEIRQRAVNAGLDVGDLGESYYPHFIDYDEVFKDKNKYNQAINHIVKTGQAPNAQEAIRLLGYARDVSRNRKFGNLEASRLVDIPFYDKTPNSLMSYITGSTKRIAQTETLGAKDEKALDLIARAGQEGADTEAMKNAYDVASGAKQYSPSASKFSQGLRQYNSTTRLGLGAITNVSQNVNTGVVTGHLRTMGAMLGQLDPKNRKFVEETGVVADGVINDLREQAGFVGKVLGKITAPGFSQVEKFNRSVSAVAGRQYGNSLASKGKVDALRKLGVTGDIGKQLTPEQEIQVARRVVEKTQFKVDPQDLPGWVDSPLGKIVSQFRTFSYNQSKFFSNEVLKPLAKGNIMPIARVAAAMPLGYALMETKRVINNRPEEEDKKRQAVEAFGNIGGAGLVMDVYKSMVPLNNKYLPPDRRVSMAVSTFGGPSAGLGAELVGAISEVGQKKKTPDDGLASNKLPIQAGTNEDGDSQYYDATQLARLGMRQIPIVGSRLQNSLLPYKEREDVGSPSENIKEGIGSFFGGISKIGQGEVKADDNKAKSFEDIKNADKLKTKEFKKQFSKQDYDTLSMNPEERQQLIDNGIKSEEDLQGLDRYALAKRKELGMDAGDKGQAVPKDIDGTDDKVKEFYNDRSYVHDMDYETWQTNAPDTDSGKDLIRRVNQLKPEGLPELPQNNKTAELYAEFVKKRADEKWSPTIENNQKKKLLRDIYSTQVSQEEKTLLSQSDSIIRASLVNGEIDQETMNRLVELDDIQAKLGGSPQIGKTLRIDYGYGLAPSLGGSGTPAYKSLYEGTADSLTNRKQLRSLLSKYA